MQPCRVSPVMARRTGPRGPNLFWKEILSTQGPSDPILLI
jgi:hypothetical protein